MNGSSQREHLKLVSSNANPLEIELAQPAETKLVSNARRTFASIGDGFSDVSALALYDAKALSDTPQFAKDFLNIVQNKVPDNFYTNINGEAALVKTLSLKGKQNGLHYTQPENILVTGGAVNAFYCLCQSLCAPGDVILALSPSYILFANAVNTFGAEMVLAPSYKGNDKFIIDPVALSAQIKSILASGRKIKAVLIVNPTNIDSQCWTRQDIDRLAPVLSEYGFPLIEDRVYDGLQYDMPQDAAFFAEHPSFAHRTITIDSVSKRYGATQWRIGWIYGPERLIEAARSAVMQTIWSPNSKYQLASALMILSSLSRQNQNLAQQMPETKELADLAIECSDAYQEYFKNLHKEYIRRRDLCLYLINGSQNYKNLAWKFLSHETVLKSKYDELINNATELKDGVTGFAARVLPQAGMFLLLQAKEEVFQKLSAYKYPDLIFARLLYKLANVVMLPPTELTLPENEHMFRMEFGINLDVLVESLKHIHKFTDAFLRMTDDEISILIENHFVNRDEISAKAEETSPQKSGVII